MLTKEEAVSLLGGSEQQVPESPQPMEFESWNIQCINDKLECIFKGLIALKEPDL